MAAHLIGLVSLEWIRITSDARMWTGEFDSNTLRVDEEVFESGKKKLRIKKYPDTCGQGVTYTLLYKQQTLQKKKKKKKKKIVQNLSYLQLCNKKFTEFNPTSKNICLTYVRLYLV